MIDGFTRSLQHVAALKGDRNVIFYGSAFLQKMQVPQEFLIITHEDINGFMSTISGFDRSKGLTLILHTPGGVTNAAESIVAYLRHMYADFEVVVPAFAMSAGTMISLASDHITMAKHGQLGPIDPQMQFSAGRSHSARSIVEQFQVAQDEIQKNPVLAHAWAPVNAVLGPSVLHEAQSALDYSEQIVGDWLSRYMFKGESDPKAKGTEVAQHFNDAATHKSHGKRIGFEEAEEQGLKVTRLEADPVLQDAVLTAYHRMTILMEQTPVTKIIWGSNNSRWVKQWNGQQ
ncbi:SDH family Clp fold serine proteinase [Arthrobacter terricola]|uniref:S49 family peptidase n=2 Tax=Arthrobacter TaxID=1663 RepID=A0A4R5KA37_9MICC|nr:ATP-dependent Clp protease proteolytic subunit [Arthrobacter terricola]MBT8162778.1 ATP-dependent Clp protease proteolytic subunit [Arthrobacter sp. GN70]TDF92061.1 S49 family peptidase [Arthrobacter terricola]